MLCIIYSWADNTEFSELNLRGLCLCELPNCHCQMAAAEAAFKDVPEIFEVCFFVLVNRVLFPTSSRSNRENPSSRELKLSVCNPNLWRTSSSPTFRAATFRELGPPDLCHIIKSNGRAGQRDVSPDINAVHRGSSLIVLRCSSARTTTSPA